MSTYAAMLTATGALAGDMRDLQQHAAQQYKPVVDAILLTRSRDILCRVPAEPASHRGDDGRAWRVRRSHRWAIKIPPVLRAGT